MDRNQTWREQVAEFRVSGVWIACARSFRRAHPLCERCRAKGIISPATEVHHKIRLTPANINNPMITLNWDNLEALCGECHRAETWKRRRERRVERRWIVDDDGNVQCRPPSPTCTPRGSSAHRGS